MGLTLEEIANIKEDYVKDYFEKEPYKQYLNGVGISNLRLRVGNEKIDLKEGETLDDYCLNVYLTKKLPNDITLPLEYKSVRVFYKIVKNIKAH